MHRRRRTCGDTKLLRVLFLHTTGPGRLARVEVSVRRLSKGKIPPPHIEKEICDAGFAYTNQICLAVEDCTQIASLGRDLLVWAQSMVDGCPVVLTALQIACVAFRRAWRQTFSIWGGGIFPLNTDLERAYASSRELRETAASLCIANMSGSGRLELVMLTVDSKKICIA